MNSKSSIVLLWCFIFILGGVAGWFGNYIYRDAKIAQTAGSMKDSRSNNDDDKDEELRKLVADLVRELRLDAEQQESLKNILYETRIKYQEINKEFQPRYKMIRDESDDRIREILRDDQRERFEEVLKPFRSQRSSAVGLKSDSDIFYN
jgi:uncharacterized protein YpuA (DUF1002 family)